MTTERDSAEQSSAPETLSSAPAPNPQICYRMDGPPPKRSNPRLVVGLIIGGTVAVLAVAVAVMMAIFSYIGGLVNVPNYQIGGDSFPALYAAVGERKAIGLQLNTVNGLQTYRYRFHTDTPSEDAQAYRTLLSEKEGYFFTVDETNANSGHFQVITESPTEVGVILILDFYWNTNVLTVCLRHGPEASFTHVPKP